MEYPRIMPPATTADPAELLAADAPFTDLATAPVVVAPEQNGPGAWAGGPSAQLVGDTIYLLASTRGGLGAARPRTVRPGSDRLAVKDPVVVHHAGQWHAWASCHPLDDPDQTDRMTTEHATSDDGVDWTWHGTALAGRPGGWDARGVRVAAVRLDGPRPVAWYDGRATAEQNWEEQTGLATVDEPGHLTAVGTGPAGVSPYGLGGLRYVSPVRLPDGSTRFYVEVTRPDGAHDLRTVLVPHAPS